jgi:hypothetical protein
MRKLVLLVLVPLSVSQSFAQAPGDLADLTRVQPARSRRVSSAAESPFSNRDNLWIPPGETRVLADLRGPAVINHIWLTFSEARPNWLSGEGSANPSEMVLRMFWDDAEQPAVEAPLGDFFAAGFGVRREVRSNPVSVESGDSYNCYWQMPFFKRARVELVNQSTKRINAFYYHIDYTEQESLPPETAYFCAQYRQEFPSTPGRDYLILDAEGQGHLVGVVLSVRARSPEWFGEGDDKFYIDGEETPSIWGTGTEDFVSCAWGLSECSYPYYGAPYVEGDWGDVGTRMCAYRWFIADPVRFRSSLRLEIEHWGWISADETASGKVEGFVERDDDFASVAFWYQKGQPKRFAELPSAAEREFPSLDRIVEGKALMASARHSGGVTELQKGYDWTGDGQLFFKPAAPDRSADAAAEGEASGIATAEPWIECDFEVKAEEYRRLVLRLTHSYDYGTYTVHLDGKKVAGPIDLYARQIEVHDRSLGDYTLSPGRHTIRLECTGQNPLSTGRYLGVDSVRLRERWLKKRSNPGG